MSVINGLTQIGVGLKAIGSWVKTKTIEGADKIARDNPMVRVFLDSPIGSNIEKEVEKAYSTAWYKKIKETFIGRKLPDEVTVALGKLIGQGSARVLDMTKLNYQLAKGWITTIQYRNELTKRTLCGISTMIDKGWIVTRPLLKKGLHGVLAVIGVPENLAEKAASVCSHALGLVKDKVAEFFRSEKVVEVAQNMVNTISEGIIKVVNAGKKIGAKIREKTTEVLTSIATTAKETVNALYEGAKTTLRTVEKGYETVKGWCKRLIFCE